jgi:hypothetical protein
MNRPPSTNTHGHCIQNEPQKHTQTHTNQPNRKGGGKMDEPAAKQNRPPSKIENHGEGDGDESMNIEGKNKNSLETGVRTCVCACLDCACEQQTHVSVIGPSISGRAILFTGPLLLGRIANVDCAVKSRRTQKCIHRRPTNVHCLLEGAATQRTSHRCLA